MSVSGRASVFRHIERLARSSLPSSWAATGMGLYHFRIRAIDQRRDTPELSEDLPLSFTEVVPKLLVVSTVINWRESVSGPTPLVAVRQVLRR